MTSPVKRYGYINAKLRARIGSMLDESKFENLLRSGSVEELLQQLKETPYAFLVSLYDDTGDIQRLEAALFERSIVLHKDVVALLDGRHAEAVAALTRKLEVENLKNILRLWFSNAIKSKNIDYRFGYLYQGKIISDIDWNKIINSTNLDELGSALAHTPYAPIIAKQSMEKLSNEGLFALETALDRIWFHLLRESVVSLPPSDRSLFLKVLDNDADLKNAINLVRFGYLYQMDEIQLRSLMLEGGSLAGSAAFESFLKISPSQRSPVELVRKRFPSLAAEMDALPRSGASVIERQTQMVENYLRNLRKREFTSMLGGYPFSIGIILAYFFLSDRQDAMIRSLLHGKYYGWDAQITRGFVQ